MDETLKEANLKRSVKKFFWDTFYTGESIQVYFDRLNLPPENGSINQWISVRMKDLIVDQVSSVDLLVHLFTKRDWEGDQLAALRDTVFNCLQGGIEFYDADWTQLGGLKVYHDHETETMNLPDGIKMKTLTLNLKWGAVY